MNAHNILTEERRARMAAERLLEQKQAELNAANRMLSRHAISLSEDLVETREVVEVVKGENVKVRADLDRAHVEVDIAKRRLWNSLQALERRVRGIRRRRPHGDRQCRLSRALRRARMHPPRRALRGDRRGGAGRGGVRPRGRGAAALARGDAGALVLATNPSPGWCGCGTASGSGWSTAGRRAATRSRLGLRTSPSRCAARRCWKRPAPGPRRPTAPSPPSSPT